MQKVLTAEEMREVDRLTTEEFGIPSLLLMENAAHAAARAISEKIGGIKAKSFLILCGKGNNGGDGAALARILWSLGGFVQVNLIGKVEETKGDARVNFEIIEKLSSLMGPGGIQIREFDESINWASDQLFYSHYWDVFIDAVFGTGLSRPLSDRYVFLSMLDAHRKTNQSARPYLVSLDLPSGFNSNSNEPLGSHFKADLTVTFTAPKLANVFPPASNFNGELVVAKIGSPPELVDGTPSKLFVTEIADVQNWLESTGVRTDSYKKTRGTALIIAGSENYSGAAVLVANACFAAGTGMVTAAVPGSIKEIVAQKTSDEIIVKDLERTNVLTEKVEIIAIGCGLANDERTHRFVRETVGNRQTPMVLDAEALNALAPLDVQGSDDLPLILTPHIGEFRRLLGREPGEDKIEEVRNFAEKHHVILVLKGERSLVAKPDGTVVINPTGNAGISRAGAGDTLAGIITAFLAQTPVVHKSNLETAFEAVVAALYLAGLAGDIAAEQFSQRLMTATDVRQCLQMAIEKLAVPLRDNTE